MEAARDGLPRPEVPGVDVAADPKRILLAQPLLGRSAQAVREEIPAGVAKHDVRDDLLKARIVLDLRARLEEVALANHGLVSLQVLADEPMPRAVGKDVLATHAQHLLGGHGHTIRTRPRPNTAISSAVPSIPSSHTSRQQTHAAPAA